MFDLRGAEIYDVVLCLNFRDDIKLEQSDYPVPDFGYKQDNGDIRPLGKIAKLEKTGSIKSLCMTINLANITHQTEAALFPIYR